MGRIRELAAPARTAGEALDDRPEVEIHRQDAYARWYVEDAGRVVQVESYEGGYHHARRIKMVGALLRRAGVRRILDLGCGDGWQVGRLVAAGFEVTGSDLSLQRLHRARAYVPRARGFFVSDMRRPSLRTASQECIYLGQVLEHLPEPEAVLASLRPLLRPGGYLILDTPCRDNLVDDLLRLSGLDTRYPEALEWGLSLDPGHIHFFGLARIVEILERAGYEIVATRGAPRLRWNTPRLGNVLAAHRSLWRVHDALECLLGWLPRYRRVGAIIVCLARRPLEGSRGA